MHTTNYTDFLQFFRKMTDLEGLPYPADQHRRNLPIALYIRPFATGGLDYAQVIRDVADEFDAFFDQRTFSVATTPLPSERIETTYDASAVHDSHIVLEWTTDWYPLVSLVEFREEYTTSVEDAFKLVIRHELGHALGLNHSTDTRHLMLGGPAPAVSHFDTDEIAVMRTYYAIPRGWNVRSYERN
jgi:hypothetical protein